MKILIKKIYGSLKQRINPIIPIWYAVKLIIIFVKSGFTPVTNKEINKIHSLTFRVFAQDGGKGGGAGVLSMQKVVLGDYWGRIPLVYNFFKENWYSRGRPNLWDIFGGAWFAIVKTKYETDAAYITHDYGTAFGLALMKKKYVMVCHAQGPNLEERINYGFQTNFWEKKLINFCEGYAFRKATLLCFPSIGAKDYFFNSKYRSVNLKRVKIGPPLYNTLYAEPIPEKIEGLERSDDTLTFLSVGQMTTAKGLDRCPEFFEKLLAKKFNKIRWIMVGDGILRDEIVAKAQKLADKYSNFSYVHYKRLSYRQTDHAQNISDIYIMLQRISIFDLATLEVMKKGKVVILSNVGGNSEFNKKDNIILCDNADDAVEKFLSSELKKLAELNKEVFEEYFSKKCFVRCYHALMDELIHKARRLKGSPKTLDDVEKKISLDARNIQLALVYHKETFSGYKGKYYGQDVVLVASGPSVNYADYSKFPKKAVYVGVNRSFLNENVALDYLFVQDMHKNHEKIDNYKGNNCQKFYALLPYRHLYNYNLRPIPEDNLKKAGAKRFVLEETLNSRIALNIEAEPFGDFQSTVFSAMQFILYTHPKKIYLLGCDCSLSGYFYGDTQHYLAVENVVDNWRRFKYFTQTYYPGTSIISINPLGLKGIFEEI